METIPMASLCISASASFARILRAINSPSTSANVAVAESHTRPKLLLYIHKIRIWMGLSLKDVLFVAAMQFDMSRAEYWWTTTLHRYRLPFQFRSACQQCVHICTKLQPTRSVEQTCTNMLDGVIHFVLLIICSWSEFGSGWIPVIRTRVKMSGIVQCCRSKSSIEPQ